MEDKLKKVMAQTFNMPVEKITESASPDTIESWDSLNHINLIMAIEQAFGLTFDAKEIIEMLNYKLILLTIKQKLRNKISK